MSNIKNVIISTEYIKLDQFLKHAEIISSGGEARIFITDNDIIVNGVKEERRGRKLRSGDILFIKNKEYIIKNSGDIE